METKLRITNHKRRLCSLAFIIFSISYPLLAQDSSNNKTINNLINPFSVDMGNVSNRDPKLIVNSNVILINDNSLLDLSGFDRVGNYIFETSPGKLKNLIKNNSPIIKNKNILKLVIDSSNQLQISDGTIIVIFNNSSDIANINQEYSLILQKSFIDLKMGEFITKDFNNLEELVANLRDDNRVKSANISLINPRITPH